jgi:hypothetical protein
MGSRPLKPWKKKERWLNSKLPDIESKLPLKDIHWYCVIWILPHGISSGYRTAQFV